MRSRDVTRTKSLLMAGSLPAMTAFLCVLLSSNALGAPASPAGEFQLAQTVQTYNLTLPLIFQNAYLGDVPVNASADGKVSINVERFVSMLGERISTDMAANLRQAAGGQQVVAIEAFAAAGVTVVYDSAKLELRASIPVSQQGGQSISALDGAQRGQPSPVTIPPERFSGTVTFTARQAYVWSPDSLSGWDPFRVSGDLAMNFFGVDGVYLLAQGEYDEASASPFHRGNVVLFHDDTDNAFRTSIGDVTPIPAGFQASPILGGLSFQRAFGEIQPLRNIRPSGLFRFSLDRASTVDVVVNGTVIRTLRLDAGQYDLKDFPLFNGLNDVELYVTDEFGRHLIASFSQFFSARLLNQGVTEFGATAGAPQLRGSDDDLSYDTDNLTFSGYARYGLTDDITIGANFQINEMQWLGGTELGWSSPIGTLGIVTGWSDIDGLGSGNSVLATYEASADDLWFLRNPAFNLSALYTSEFFAPVGTTIPANTSDYEFRSRFSTQLPLDLGFGISASYLHGRDTAPDERTYGLSLSHSFGFADLTASGEHTERSDTSDENRVLVSLTVPLSERENSRASYDSQSNQVQVEYARFQRPELDDYGVRVALVRDEEKVAGSGEFSFNANRFALLLEHEAIADSAMGEIQSQRSTYTVATQLAFAGEHVAFGRPVGSRFAIVVAHETLDDSPVGVAESKGGQTREAQTDFLGAALVSAGNAYQPQSVFVDVENLPAGYDIGTGQYDLFPGAVAGYAVTVGSDASHVVMGNLVYADGKPLSLLGGEVRAKEHKDFKPVLVFTNSAGRFFAEGLAPGKYDMVLGAAMDIVVPIEVPENVPGVIDVGTITVQTKGS